MRKLLLIGAFAALAALLTPTAVEAQTLSASSVLHNTARLSISGHSAAWWYKRTSPGTGICVSVSAGGSAAVFNLRPLTTYKYQAYSNGGCSTALGSEVTFTTPIYVGNWTGTFPIYHSPRSTIAAVAVSELSDSSVMAFLVTLQREGSVEWWAHPVNDSLDDCDRDTFYIPQGAGDLSDAAQVQDHESALEMLDVAKLALLTQAPVEAVIDTSASRYRMSGGQPHCPLIGLKVLPP